MATFFDLCRLKAKCRVLTKYIRDTQYGDDITIFSDIPEDLQTLLSSYDDVAKRMGLHINTAKRETMCIGNTTEFFLDGTKLANVTRLKYLSSYVSSDCSKKGELASHIQAASCAPLCKRVFDSHDLTVFIKVAVYNQSLMPLLLYDSETWTLYQHEVRQLCTIQQRHLCLILNIKWGDFISNEEVLRQANVKDIEIKLERCHLRWFGHVCWMHDDRLVKELLYCELAHGSHKVGRPRRRFKDTCLRAMAIGSKE